MNRIITTHRIRIVLGMVALATLSLLPSLLAIFIGKLPFNEDVLSLFVPWRTWTGQSLQAGILPLWNPHLFGGIPFMSNGQTSVLYLPNVIYWFLPIGVALFLDVLLHSALLGCGGYLLARALSRSQAASWLCAICLMLGNGVAAHLYAGHMTWHAARAYLPLLVWALICFLKKHDVRYLWALAVFLSLQVFAGYPPYVLWSVCWCLVFAAIWWFAGKRQSHLRLRRVRFWQYLLPAALFLSLSAMVVLPLAQTSRQGRHLTYENAIEGSTTFNSWIRLALPEFFGGNYHVQWSIEKFSHEEAAYIGLLPLCLALFAPLLWRWYRNDKAANTSTVGAFCVQRFVNLLWWILPITMILALGKYMPLYHLFFEYFPPLRLFRVPARWFEIWYFAACILAAFGLDALLNVERNRTRIIASVLLGMAVVFLCAAIVIGISHPESYYWVHVAQWNRQAISHTLEERLAYGANFRSSALQSAVTGCLFAMYSAWVVNRLQESNPARRLFLIKGLLLVIVVELTMLFWMSARFIADKPPQNPWTKQLIAMYKPGERWNTSFTGLANFFGLNLGLPGNIDVLGGYDTMASRDFFEFANAIEHRTFWSSNYQVKNYDPLWRVAGITHVPASARSRIQAQIKVEGARPIARFGRGEEAITLWKMPDSWPRAFLTSQVNRQPRDKQLPVLQEFARQTAPVAVADVGAFANIVVSTSKTGEVIGLQRETNRALIQVKTERPQVLVLSEANAPGWSAWVNGEEQKIETTNYLFRGVEVPAGSSTVAFVYDSQTYRTSVFLSLCGLALLVGAFSFAAGNRRKPPVK